LAYQWWFNGTPINGAINDTYTINNVQPAQAGTYQVVVSNGSGAASSAVVLLTVVPSTFPLNGLSLWLRADSGSVLNGSALSQWTDLSGNERHATQSSGSSQPTLVNGAVNGLPVVRFDGVGDFLNLPLPVNGLSGMSVFLVAANTQN
jgi:hypothetical protein